MNIENGVITLEKLKECEKIVAEMTDELKNIRQAYAEQECPFKPGDITVNYGHAYRGRKMVVDRVTASTVTGSYWSVVGRMLRSNNKVGAAQCRFHQRQYEMGLEGIEKLVNGSDT